MAAAHGVLANLPADAQKVIGAFVLRYNRVVTNQDSGEYHFSPDLLSRVVDAIFLLTRSKDDVLLFFRSCGVPDDPDLLDLAAALRTDREGTKKAWMARTVVERINAKRSDKYLGYRRSVLQRIVDWEDFSQVWPDKQLQAQGAVAVVRGLIDKRDAFTRMAIAEEREREHRTADARTKLAATAARNSELARIGSELAAQWTNTDPHLRGSIVEKLMNEFFAVEGVQVREAFHVVGRKGEGIVEQIDEVIELDGRLFLVEIKWHNDRLGPDKLAHPIVRLFSRPEASGLIISSSGFTDAGITTCREAITGGRLVVLAETRELLFLIERRDPLAAWLRAKTHSAILDKEPLSLILS